MTLCLFAVVLDDGMVVFCPLCGQKFCNIRAVDEHLDIYHDRDLTVRPGALTVP
jgi:hypothetical protein